MVLTGAEVPAAIGLDPARVIGYRWKDGWVQIPVQIDQRVVVGFGTAPASNTTPGTTGTVYGDGSGDLTALQYADPDTFVGPDTDPMIDADDELVFMARDAGPRVPAGTARPADAVASGVEVDLVDAAGSHGYVYLFYGHAGVDPSAGKDYVSYDFALDSGDYKTTYMRADGPNPEHSTVVGETYQMGMIDRWKTVDLRVNGSSADILDGFKARFSFDTCGRSNDTFADAEGAFVANIDGPVRAIRSYVGANSGPRTEETMYFYANRVEIVTDLRVHAIPGIMSFADFSTAASGMQYGNSAMAGTVRWTASRTRFRRPCPTGRTSPVPPGSSRGPTSSARTSRTWTRFRWRGPTTPTRRSRSAGAVTVYGVRLWCRSPRGSPTPIRQTRPSRSSGAGRCSPSGPRTWTPRPGHRCGPPRFISR